MPPIDTTTATLTSTDRLAHTSNVGVLHSGNKIHKPELIAKIGGADVLKQAVNNFYDRLTVDPAIRVYFEGADLEVLRWHQFNRKYCAQEEKEGELIPV